MIPTKKEKEKELKYPKVVVVKGFYKQIKIRKDGKIK